MKNTIFHSIEKMEEIFIPPTAVILDSFNFVPHGFYNFQECLPCTELIVFKVTDNSFIIENLIECLFNYLTDGITVRRKMQDDFHIKPYWVVLTTENIPKPVPASLSALFDVIDCRENRFLEILHML